MIVREGVFGCRDTQIDLMNTCLVLTLPQTICAGESDIFVVDQLFTQVVLKMRAPVVAL